MADEPKLHPNAPTMKEGDPGGYVPPPPDPQGDLEAVAALMGTTAARSKEMADTVVGPAGSLTKDTFDAHAALKHHMGQTGVVAPVQQPQTVAAQTSEGVPFQVQQGYARPVQAAAFDDTQILRRFLALEDKLDKLLQLDEKIVKSLSKKNVKQITIRFNDSEDQKSK